MKLTKERKNPLTKDVAGSRASNGRVLVPITRQVSKLHPVKGAPPETFYRMDPKRNRLEHMVTMMPDGLEVAWDSCGECAMHVRACHCRAITPGRSVIHIYEIQTGTPFEKPKEQDRFGGSNPFLDNRPSAKQAKLKTPLTKTPLTKAPLVKEAPPVKQVTLTKNTSLAEFDRAAVDVSKLQKTKLLKSLEKVKRAPLTKG